MTPTWRKSSYSTGNGGECVEAGQVPGAVLVRDTKDHGTGPVLDFGAAAWATFTGSVK